MSDEDNSQYIVKIETAHPSNFKQLFNTLKENSISEFNLIFTTNGIQILEIDATRVVVIHIFLDASHFESYYCRQNVKIGLDTVNMTKIFKTIGNKDILTFFVKDPNITDQTSDNTSNFGLLIKNGTKGQIATVYINSIDVNESDVSVPNIDYPYHVTLPSSDFESIVNSLKNVGGDDMHILFHNVSLTFGTKGDAGVIEILRTSTGEEKNSMSIKCAEQSESTEIIDMYVKLDRVSEFTECTSLSSMVSIYLQNDKPLFVEYDVGNLGFIRLGLSPRKDTSEN